MNAGFLRRAIAFVADFIFIASIVSVAFTVLARPIYVRSVDNFDTLFDEFERLQTEKREALADLNDEEFAVRNNDTLTETQRETRLQEIEDERRDLDEYYSRNNYPDVYETGDRYAMFWLAYHFFGFLSIHSIYMIVLKGKSIGRKLMKLKLAGHVTILSILLRELFWKYLFWFFTLGFGLFIDMYMSLLTHNKKTLRDHLTKTRVILDDIVYPF